MIIHDVKHTPNPDSAAFDQGFELFKREPELLGVEVWWRATEAVSKVQDQFDYVTGYMTGRHQRDDYEREKKGVEQSDSETGDQAQGPDGHATIGHGDGGRGGETEPDHPTGHAQSHEE
jgi:hypothetical protein